MSRRRFLIAYDIRDPGRLRRVCRVMESVGERLQYSVFICDLSRTELIHSRAEVESVMHLAVDSVVIVDLGDVSAAKFTFIGRSVSLPARGPQIV